MMSFQLVVPMESFGYTREQFRGLPAQVYQAVGNNIRKLLPGLLRSSLGRFQTGELARSARVYVSIDGVRIAFTAKQAEYVFLGVAPHTIDMKAMGKTWPMRWNHAASRVPAGIAWKVNHPGQRARVDIIQEIEALIEQEVMIALGGLLPTLAGGS
jgi:hypothetical protein